MTIDHDEQQVTPGAASEAQPDAEALAARCRELEQTLRALLDNLPIIAWRVDRSGTFTLHDGKGMEAVGFQRGQHVGKNIFELYGQEDTRPVRNALQGTPDHVQADTDGASWETWTIPVRDEHGEILGVVGATLDTTEVRRAEHELRAHIDLIERQRQVLQQMSTPILQVWEGVLALPMIGVVDSSRTAEVMDSLLDAVAQQRARFAILDLTGVEAVDTKTASYLIELVRAIRLLGAEGVIIGIRPSVAQTVVAIGVDLGGITTLGNLRAGLRHCIVQMRRQQADPAPGT